MRIALAILVLVAVFGGMGSKLNSTLKQECRVFKVLGK